MTTKEFNVMLENYDLNNLTDEQVYKICTEFLTLPRKEKNWTSLNERLNNFKNNGESLRCWFKAERKNNGELEANPLVLKQDEVPENLTSEEIENKFNEKIEQLYKAKYKAQQAAAEHKRLLKSEAHLEELHASIKECSDALKSIKITPAKKTAKMKNEACLLIGDWHIGSLIDNFINKYNFEIAKQRVEKLVTDTIEICKRNNVGKLNVINLGDMCNGMIHVTNRIESEFDVVTQTMYASELIAQILTSFQENIPEVVYRSVLDNHSRLSRSYDEHIEKENMNRIIDWYVEERVKNTNIVISRDNIDDNLGTFLLNNGKRVCFLHGHAITSPDQAFQCMVGACKEYVDYVFFGHFHAEKLKPFQGCRVIVNGSLMGTDAYALSKGLFAHTPSQTLLIFEDNNCYDCLIGVN